MSLCAKRLHNEIESLELQLREKHRRLHELEKKVTIREKYAHLHEDWKRIKDKIHTMYGNEKGQNDLYGTFASKDHPGLEITMKTNRCLIIGGENEFTDSFMSISLNRELAPMDLTVLANDLRVVLEVFGTFKNAIAKEDTTGIQIEQSVHCGNEGCECTLTTIKPLF